MPWVTLGASFVTGTLGFLGAQDSNRQANKAAKAQYEQAKKIYE